MEDTEGIKKSNISVNNDKIKKAINPSQES